MIYKLNRLDGRHSHNSRFQYYLGFTANMANRSGPLHFNDAMAWCIKTYGWSAEVNQTAKIMSWTSSIMPWSQITNLATGIIDHAPEFCNPYWSWSNHIGSDLRIYLRGDGELAFFQLAHPVDQKIQR
jgi:hypothetical protein